MINFRILLLLLSFHLAHSILFAQEQKLIIKTTTESWITLLPAGSGIENFNNHIIKEIAHFTDKGPGKVAVHISAKLTIMEPATTIDQEQFHVSINKIELSGDIHYRGFDLSNVLIPTIFEFELLQVRKGDTISVHICGEPRPFEGNKDKYEIRSTKYEVKSKKNALFEPNQPQPKTDNPQTITDNPKPAADSSQPMAHCPRPDTTWIENASFYYIKADYDNFLARLDLIDNYYASCAIIDTLLVFVQQMDFRDTSRLPRCFIQLEEMNKMEKLILGQDFPERLMLETNDPAGFSVKSKVFRKFLLSADMNLREQVGNGQIIKAEFNTDSLIQVFLSGILRVIRWSQEAGERHATIYREFLDTCFVLKAFDDQESLIRELCAKFYPDKDVDEMLKDFSRQIKKGYDYLANKLIGDHWYTDAILLMENEGLFIWQNNYLKGQAPDTIAFRNARTGIYHAFLGLAESSLAAGLPDLTSEYLSKAVDYRKKHPDAVFDDSLYYAINNEYQKFIKAGSDSTGKPSPAHDLVILLKEKESLIWRNQLTEARLLADSMTIVQREQGFENDSALAMAIRQFHLKIDARICSNANDTFDIRLIRSERLIENREYRLGAGQIDSALLFAKSHPACLFRDKNARDTLEKYRAAILYQKLQNEILEKETAGNYSGMIFDYYRAMESFRDNRIDRFGLTCDSLYEYIQSKNNHQFTIEAILYHEKQDQLTEALRYLKLLCFQDYPSKKAKEIMEPLAREMAFRDYQKMPYQDPLFLVKGYIGLDSRFNAFKRAYIWEWNTLKNE